jgi:hypothetical protein
MVGVGSVSVTEDFGVNPGAPRFGVFEFLQHDNAAAFAHDEAVSINIKRA